MPVTNYQLEFYTSYRQFYIADKESSLKTDSIEFWTQEAIESRLAVEEGLLGVGTECYGPIKATLTLRTGQNTDYDYKNFDHIVEGSIRVRSSILQILNCPDSNVELEVKVQPDNYRVRVYSSNLNSVKGDEGDDFYVLEVWPDEYQERKVITKFLY